MKIGIDLDGVILDYERVVRTKAELYDLIELNGNGAVHKDELKLRRRYNWTEEVVLNFFKKYFIDLNNVTPLVAGAKEVIEYLKKDGHELIIITARGTYIEEMIEAAQEILTRENLVFDKYYWKAEKKLDACKRENIDIMIDDNYIVCEELAKNKVKTLYFRDINMKELQESEYLKEVNNWGEIYRFIRNER